MVAAIAALAACGGDGHGNNNDGGGSGDGGGTTPTTKTLSGVVSSSGYVPGSTSGDPTIKPGYYAGATVFLDSNANGKLDDGETSATTDSAGTFALTVDSDASGPLVADITTSSTNTALSAAVPAHLILRASAAQIADQGEDAIVISPMSSEVQRLVEADSSDYATEKAALATRLSAPFNTANALTISGADALADVNTLSGDEQSALLFEDNALTNRYVYATAKFDRGDLYPDNLAVKGGDPRLVDLSGVSTATAVTPQETQAAITFAEAQQAAFNIEGIPRYDNIFVIIMENKSTDAIVGNARAPNINKILDTYDQFSTYYSTGKPSEPNYIAVGGGDDFGITDDNWWGCAATGDNAPTDVAFAGGTASDGQPLPAMPAMPTATGALSGYSSTCSGTNHNISAANLFTQISSAGLTWRVYNESMNPGQDPRTDSVADSAVVDTYNEGGVTGTADYAVPGGLYKTKHHPGMGYQLARNLPEFYADNRTVIGTQYTPEDWAKSTAYTIPQGYDYDQLGTDLATGDVGQLNFVIPDQCDDMHGTGSDTSCAGDNSGQSPIINRGDYYVGMIVDKIQASALWKNPNRHEAIVIMYDEGEGSATSCCGWNAGGKNSGTEPLVQNADGSWSQASAVTNYGNGNIGHGNSIFAVITNGQDVGSAPKGVADTDTYSHFSFTRTLEDMFQLSDPVQPETYVNRAKYTEYFIAQNITNLPEFAGSADTHFDAVRPMNHAYVIPDGYEQKLNPADIQGVQNPDTGATDGAITPQTGPDANQDNIWATQ
ncbi:alkaline phosphatase family protein [Solimonas marina]|uniref:Phosphoesterase n=1 Tax=Solimonas marina TaxID=2714601 RepID=A0A970B4Z5_9GAMM|nr:phosphoesterase [Solimonas marina]